MTYRIIVTSTATKERRRLEAKSRRRVDDTLISLRETPWPRGARKIAGSRNDWRIRVGDYRVLYEVDTEQEVITIWRIAHRREAYR